MFASGAESNPGQGRHRRLAADDPQPPAGLLLAGEARVRIEQFQQGLFQRGEGRIAVRRSTRRSITCQGADDLP